MALLGEAFMSVPATGRSRPGRVLLWVSAGLMVIFLGLVAFQKFVHRLRFSHDADLVRELASAELEESSAGLDPKAWPQWRGPRRDGVTTAADLLAEWPANGPRQLWRIEGGDGYSSFAAANGALYGMLAQTDGKEAVVCWDARTGKERWRRAYEPGASYDYGGPRATPTIDGQRLYAASSSGLLMCLDIAGGKVKWERDLRQELGAVAPRWGFAFSPLVEGGRVFATPGGRNGRCLAAFDKESGKLLWATQDDPAGYSSPVAMTPGGIRQIVFFTGKRLLGVTPEEGKLLWEFPWDTQFEVNAATPEVIRARLGAEELNYVFISSGYGKGCALVKIAPRKGGFRAKAVYQSNELCCHFASPVRFGEHLYALDETRDLTCLEIRTGKVAWRQKGFKKGSLLRVDNHLIVLGEDGKLALLEANPKEYRELARARPFRNRCWTMPVLADGRLFLRDQKQVKCLDLRKR
jgi:outer membrane protein assembly factor BamB